MFNHKKINTVSYDIIECKGFLDVHLVKGIEGKLSVTTDDNIHQYVDVFVKEGILTLMMKSKINIKTRKGVHVMVPY